MSAFERVVLVTQKTALEEMIERDNNRAQVKFRMMAAQANWAAAQEQRQKQPNSSRSASAPAAAVADYSAFEAAHDAYHAALGQLKAAMPEGVRLQMIERGFLPNFLFGERDLVVALGRDGLVVNIAKYLNGQPLMGFNPDPRRIDGVLLPFRAANAAQALPRALAGGYPTRPITMAKATLNDGQKLYAVNDLFIGQRTHLSARYRLEHRSQGEDQSSSGVIVSTGAGSTGWFRSILAGAAGVAAAFGGEKAAKALREQYRFPWDATYLCFSVREPFASKASAANLTFGRIEAGEELILSSQMPRGGVIFSDGVEADYLEFNSGSIASITPAEKKVNLVSAG